MGKMRIISLVLILVMLSGMTAYGAEPTNWSDKAIENAVSNGLFNSVTAKSLSNEDLSRAEMAAVINHAFGCASKASLDNFTDVPKEAWFYDDMAKAVKMGTFKGSEGKLSPESKITREEAFAVLARGIKLTGTDLTVLGKFSDAADISSWAKPEIAAMVTAGYVKGADSKLNPKGNITRAEFAQIMDNLIKGYIQAAGTYTSVPNGNIMINTPNVNLKGVTVTGDLIIGDGVGNGEVTLDSVKVIGRTIVRGGGVNSIKIIGDSSMGTVIVTRVDGQVRVVVSGGANVQVIEIADGSDDVIVEGTIGSIDVKAAGITVTANNAKIGTVNIEAAGAKMVVGAGSAIDYIKVEAAGTTVTGTGTVTKVEVYANNVKVDTPNTSVSAGAGTTGVTAGGKAVGAGGTVSSTPASNPEIGSRGGSHDYSDNDDSGDDDSQVPSLMVGAQNGILVSETDAHHATYTVTTTNISDGEAVTISGCTADGTMYGEIHYEGFAITGTNVVNNTSTLTAVADHATAGTIYFKVTIAGVTSELVTLVVTPAVKVTGISVASAGDATELENGGTLQMSAAVTPTDADNKKVTWSVDGTLATIDTEGLLTATSPGTVTVKATAQDYSGVAGEKDITITTAAEYFTFDKVTGEITDYDVAGGLKVVIPSKIGGVAVTGIGEGAFAVKLLTGVTIPDGVTRIGTAAFCMNNLSSVIIPDSVIIIDDVAFANNELTSVTIPNKVTEIGSSSFSDNKLASVTIGTKVATIGNGAFENNELTSVTIPDSVIKISSNAFKNNLLVDIIIPNNVNEIGNETFATNKLTSVTIGTGMETIGSLAFSGNNLASITIGVADTFICNELLAAGNNLFRDTYTAAGGGAGTYTGTQTGAWTKAVDFPSVSVGVQKEYIFSIAATQSATYDVTTAMIPDGAAVIITGCTSDGTTIGVGPTTVGEGITVSGSNVSDNASTITATVTDAATGTYYFKVTINDITPAIVRLYVTPTVNVNDIAGIIGTAQVGATLTAGTLTPEAATVSYQWTICGISDGDYVNIPLATLSTYVVKSEDLGKYVKVSATGTGGYTGTVTSTATGAVAESVDSQMVAAAKLAVVDGTITVAYGSSQMVETAAVQTYVNGLISNGVTAVVTNTSPGGYDVAYSMGAATDSESIFMERLWLLEPITVSGDSFVGSVLTSVTTPTDATVTYKWQRADITDGDYSNIDGATLSTYTLTDADEEKFIKVTATGTGSFTGTQTSTANGPITVAMIPSTIVFEDTTPSKVVGSGTYTNAVSGDGNGEITYSSGTPATATVDAVSGEVTIVAAGATVITATKAATDTYETVTNTYTLIITPTFAMVTVGEAQTYTIPTGYATWMDTVTASVYGGYEMSTTETTYELWYPVRVWAQANGYTFQNQGREGDDGIDGAAPTEAGRCEPVTYVNWGDTLVWLNALSEMEGKDPVYRTTDDINGEVIKDSRSANQAIVDTAKQTPNDGYRLPTSMEWEMAAKWKDGTFTTSDSVEQGGRWWTPGDYASGASADITDSGATEAVAVCSGNSGGKTANVESKDANGLGIYDMSGNVMEWCFSVVSVVHRDFRGGDWRNTNYYLQVGIPNGNTSGTVANIIGFRIVRTP